MTFSTYSIVCNLGCPVIGQGTSFVRRTTLSSTTFSRSLTIIVPGSSLTAMRGNLGDYMGVVVVIPGLVGMDVNYLV